MSVIPQTYPRIHSSFLTFVRCSAKVPNMAFTNVMTYIHEGINLQISFPALALYSLASAALSLLLLYRFTLPKPIPGISYNEVSPHKLMGDVPGMVSHIKQAGGTFITYIMESIKSLNAPLIQVFIRPLSKPLLILADFREAHDMLIHWKDFDRSPSLGDLVKGLAPDYHIHLPTNAACKTQRRLVQNLMAPSFLHRRGQMKMLNNVIFC